MKVYYWSPFISKVATVSSVIRSANSLLKYSKSKTINVGVINAIGEWDELKDTFNKKIEILNLNNSKILNFLPKGGYLKSRTSYLIIFFLNFFKLLSLIRKKNPDFLIIHLITVVPLFLLITSWNVFGHAADNGKTWRF